MSPVVVLLDQFCGPSPHDLARTPRLWSDFMAAVDRGDFNPAGVMWRHAHLMTEKELAFGQPIATTAYRCGANGYVEIVSMRWDSSG